jgi:hypothetical protein
MSKNWIDMALELSKENKELKELLKSLLKAHIEIDEPNWWDHNYKRLKEIVDDYTGNH